MHSSLQPDVKSIVIDSEAVAWDKVKKKILPFQVSVGEDDQASKQPLQASDFVTVAWDKVKKKILPFR